VCACSSLSEKVEKNIVILTENLTELGGYDKNVKKPNPAIIEIVVTSRPLILTTKAQRHEEKYLEKSVPIRLPFFQKFFMISLCLCVFVVKYLMGEEYQIS
jgi:hypothetical protein